MPVIVYDDHRVFDSWIIAEYLDKKYPAYPMLFEGASMKTLTRFIPALATVDKAGNRQLSSCFQQPAPGNAPRLKLRHFQLNPTKIPE